MASIYLAGRYDERDHIRSLQAELQKHGHIITADWTTHRPIPQPGSDPGLARQYAAEDLDGVLRAEVFILIASALKGGTGSHTELGFAIRQLQLTGRPTVYVVGSYNDKSIMYFHPAVQRRRNLDEVLSELG